MERDPEWSRHHDVTADENLRDAIWLDGYDEQSVWGYDTGLQSFFAQVWDNDSDAEDPDLWLTPPRFRATSPEALVPEIIAFTEATPLAVVRALGIAHPDPHLVDGLELAAIRDDEPVNNDDRYEEGFERAYDWLIGFGPSPCARLPIGDTGSPTPEEVDAEATYATGLVLLGAGPVAQGIEEILIAATYPGALAAEHQ